MMGARTLFFLRGIIRIEHIKAILRILLRKHLYDDQDKSFESGGDYLLVMRSAVVEVI